MFCYGNPISFIDVNGFEATESGNQGTVTNVGPDGQVAFTPSGIGGAPTATVTWGDPGESKGTKGKGGPGSGGDGNGEGGDEGGKGDNGDNSKGGDNNNGKTDPGKSGQSENPGKNPSGPGVYYDNEVNTVTVYANMYLYTKKATDSIYYNKSVGEVKDQIGVHGLWGADPVTFRHSLSDSYTIYVNASSVTFEVSRDSGFEQVFVGKEKTGASKFGYAIARNLVTNQVQIAQLEQAEFYPNVTNLMMASTVVAKTFDTIGRSEHSWGAFLSGVSNMANTVIMCPVESLLYSNSLYINGRNDIDGNNIH